MPTQKHDPDLLGPPEAPNPPEDLTPPDSPADPRQALQSSRRPPLWPFVLEYWRSREALKSYVLLALLLTSSFAVTYMLVQSNRLTGQGVDQLIGRQWGGFAQTTLWSVALGIAGGLVSISGAAVTNFLSLNWRTWLTDRFLARWAERSSYYDIEREGLLQNADQRIAEDVKLFTESSLNMFTSFVGVTLQVGSFSIVLWQLSRTLPIDFGGLHFVLHGHMLIVCVLSCAVGFVLTHLVGRRLIPIDMEKQGVEADFRFLAMQVRENAEQIAFYAGGAREHVRLVERFAYVRENFVRYTIRSWKVGMMQNVYGHLLTPFPTLVALPLYFAGVITYGGVTRASGAYIALQSSLSFFTQAYSGIASWIALVNRLRDLSVAIDDAHDRIRGIDVQRIAGDALTTDAIALRTPQGASLTIVPPLQFERGQRWLIRGPSGTGKSTLLRSIAGLWPYGDGVVRIPAAATMLFLPQRSYIPSGTLHAALSYPDEPEHFDMARCIDVLEKCSLGHLAGSLETVDRWQQKLSGGEQQRVAFARVLLQRPDFVFLDEATSALDPATEKMLYTLLNEELPSSAIVSVAHRESLAEFHTSLVELTPAVWQSASLPS